MNKIVLTVPKGGAEVPEDVMVTLNGEPLAHVEEIDITLSMSSLKPIVTLSIQADIEFVEIEVEDALTDNSVDDADVPDFYNDSKS